MRRFLLAVERMRGPKPYQRHHRRVAVAIAG